MERSETLGERSKRTREKNVREKANRNGESETIEKEKI